MVSSLSRVSTGVRGGGARAAGDGTTTGVTAEVRRPVVIIKGRSIFKLAFLRVLDKFI